MDVTGLYAKIGVTKTTEDDSESGTATSQPWLNKEMEEARRKASRVAERDMSNPSGSLTQPNLGTRGKQQVQVQGKMSTDTQTKKLGKSKQGFTILEDLSEEGEILQSIKLLKQKIRDIMGPSGMSGPIHAKPKTVQNGNNSKVGMKKPKSPMGSVGKTGGMDQAQLKFSGRPP